MRWFTADTHFGHQLMVEKRGFVSDEEMDFHVIEQMNRHAGPDDELHLLGDSVLGKRARTIPLLSLLAAQTHLTSGNHDNTWTGKNPTKVQKIANAKRRYTEEGDLASIEDEREMTLLDGTTVTLSHFPFTGESSPGREDRYPEWRPTNRGQWVIHGHVHSSWLQRGRQINVGVDVWDMQPVSERQLVALIAEGPADRDTLADVPQHIVNMREPS